MLLLGKKLGKGSTYGSIEGDDMLVSIHDSEGNELLQLKSTRVCLSVTESYKWCRIEVPDSITSALKTKAKT
jgi:hypothetical protein